MSELIHSADAGQVWVGDSLGGLPEGERWSAVISDPPYSGRTHESHCSEGADGPWKRTNGKFDLPCNRRGLDYIGFGPEQVQAATSLWHARTDGWICILTDHLLAREWEAALSATGRYVFAPLPCYSPGSRVRLAGDGPSSWTVWLIVSRPRHKPYSNWGTLPGGYVYKPGKMPLVGGKPENLMRAIVNDYSRPGDLVADPCMGAGSTLAAAHDLGRRYWGMDKDRKHAEMAAGRMGGSTAMGPLFDGEM